MAGTKRRSGIRGKIIYTLILLLFAAALVLVSVTWLGRFRDYAEQYELSRPVHTLDAYLEAVNRDRWSDGIAEAVSQIEHEAQSDEEIKAFIQGKLASGITAVRKAGSAADAGTLTYSLRCSGGEVGTLTLVEDAGYRGKVDLDEMPWPLVSKFLPGMLEWGLKPWLVSSESYYFDNIYNVVEVTVPSDYVVQLNGITLGPEYIVEEGIHLDVYEDYYKYWDYLPTKVKYRFDHAIGDIQPTILDGYGNPFTIDPEAGDSQFIVPPSEEFVERCVDFAIPFTKAYLTYVSGAGDPGVNLNALKPYLMEGQDLEKRMKDAMDGLSWAHTSSIYNIDVIVNSVLELTDGYSVIDVTGNSNTYYYGKGELENSSNMKIMVYDDGERLWAESMELY